jgi:polyprenyl-phospho-N-acetylgalactosaminyl synthase
LQTGIDFALRQGADVVVTFDADGQHHGTDIESLVRARLEERRPIFALGSRFLGRSIDSPAYGACC